MRTTGIMSRKEPCFDVRDCYIEKVIVLPELKYRYFRSHMLESYDFIAENVGLMYSEYLCDHYYLEHCLLIMGEDSEDGILVESEGSDYARYTSYQPNIKSYIREQLGMVADSILLGEYGKQANGIWNISWDDITEQFELGITYENGFGEMLVVEIQKRDETIEVVMKEDGLEIGYISLDDREECVEGVALLCDKAEGISCNEEMQGIVQSM